MKVNLGGNTIIDCAAALVINGSEVFRLRQRESDGRLICDFDIHGKDDGRIAKIAKNNIVYAAEGYRVHNLPRESYVQGPDGSPVARVREVANDEIAITGVFWVKGHQVVITETSLVSGGITMSGNVIKGFGKAISINPGSFSIGAA